MNSIDLKAALSNLGWSQKNFASRLGCDEDTVSRWSTGKTDVPAHVAEYIRVVLLAKEMLG